MTAIGVAVHGASFVYFSRLLRIEGDSRRGGSWQRPGPPFDQSAAATRGSGVGVWSWILIAVGIAAFFAFAWVTK